MEVSELIKQRHRMCDYYGDDSCVRDDSRETCPALNIDCSLGTDQPERLIAIVELWEKEHPEKPEQERQKPEQGTVGYLNPAAFKEYYAPYQSVKDLKRLYEELADRIAKLEKDPVKPINEPKRTRKDVLLAAFKHVSVDSDGIPTTCPTDICHDDFYCNSKSCKDCRREYWLAESEEN